MIAIPMELREAQNYINTYHRHHQAAHRDKFRIAAMKDEKIVGVVQVGRPVSRMLDERCQYRLWYIKCETSGFYAV